MFAGGFGAAGSTAAEGAAAAEAQEGTLGTINRFGFKNIPGYGSIGDITNYLKGGSGAAAAAAAEGEGAISSLPSVPEEAGGGIESGLSEAEMRAAMATRQEAEYQRLLSLASDAGVDIRPPPSEIQATGGVSGTESVTPQIVRDRILNSDMSDAGIRSRMSPEEWSEFQKSHPKGLRDMIRENRDKVADLTSRAKSLRERMLSPIPETGEDLMRTAWDHSYASSLPEVPLEGGGVATDWAAVHDGMTRMGVPPAEAQAVIDEMSARGNFARAGGEPSLRQKLVKELHGVASRVGGKTREGMARIRGLFGGNRGSISDVVNRTGPNGVYTDADGIRHWLRDMDIEGTGLEMSVPREEVRGFMSRASEHMEGLLSRIRRAPPIVEPEGIPMTSMIDEVMSSAPTESTVPREQPVAAYRPASAAKSSGSSRFPSATSSAVQREEGYLMGAEGGLSPAGLQYRQEVASGVRYGGRGQSTNPVPVIPEIKPEVPSTTRLPRPPPKVEKLEDVRERFRRGSAYKMEDQFDALRLLEERMRGGGAAAGRKGSSAAGSVRGSGALWRKL
jgi:hypothetical protein